MGFCAVCLIEYTHAHRHHHRTITKKTEQKKEEEKTHLDDLCQWWVHDKFAFEGE